MSVTVVVLSTLRPGLFDHNCFLPLSQPRHNVNMVRSQGILTVFKGAIGLVTQGMKMPWWLFHDKGNILSHTGGVGSPIYIHVAAGACDLHICPHVSAVSQLTQLQHQPPVITGGWCPPTFSGHWVIIYNLNMWYNANQDGWVFWRMSFDRDYAEYHQVLSRIAS